MVTEFLALMCHSKESFRKEVVKHSAMIQFFSNLFQTIASAVQTVVEAVGEFFSTVASTILSIFPTILDAVVGLGIQDLTGLVGLVFGVLINIVIGLLVMLGNAGISMFHTFSLDFMSDKSLFDVVFLKGMGTLVDAITYLAFALLILFYLIHMAKLMVGPPTGKEDTPFGLIGKTFICGFLIFNTRPLASTVASFFNMFFTTMLGTASEQTLSVSEFATKAQDMMAGESFVAAIRASAQLKALLGSICVLVLLLVLLVELIKFFLEFTQRYVLFYVLLLTSPLAFTLAPSKETSPAFAKWLRMVFSEAFLLLIDVFVFRLYISAFAAYSSSLDAISAEYGEGFTAMLVWVIMLYAILYVGNKFSKKLLLGYVC